MKKIIKDILRPIYYAIIGLFRVCTSIAFKSLRFLIGQDRYFKFLHFIQDQTSPTAVVDGITFDATHRIPWHRARTLLTKEPDTIAWINEYINEGDVLFDVGANVGTFSLFSAMRRNAIVIAFEPSAANYAILNANIQLNSMDEKISALNLALHDETKISKLNLSANLPGKAGHGFDTTAAGSRMVEYKPDFQQSVVGYRMDEIIDAFDLPFPNHVKIDVDGNDSIVLAGMDGILDDPRLKSIAIELNPKFRTADKEISAAIEARGFTKIEGDRFINCTYLDGGFPYNFFFKRNG